MPHRILISVAPAASLGGTSSARAVDFFWNDPNGGAFGSALNWTPLALGGPGDADGTVNVELGTSTEERYTVIGVSGQNDRLLVHDNSLRIISFRSSVETLDLSHAGFLSGIAALGVIPEPASLMLALLGLPVLRRIRAGGQC